MHHLFDTPQFIKPFRVQEHDTIKWSAFHFIEVDPHITAHKPVAGSCLLASHYHGLCEFSDAWTSLPDLSLSMLPGVYQRHELHHQLYFYKILDRQIISFASGDLTHISDLVQTACGSVGSCRQLYNRRCDLVIRIGCLEKILSQFLVICDHRIQDQFLPLYDHLCFDQIIRSLLHFEQLFIGLVCCFSGIRSYFLIHKSVVI